MIILMLASAAIIVEVFPSFLHLHSLSEQVEEEEESKEGEEATEVSSVLI